MWGVRVFEGNRVIEAEVAVTSWQGVGGLPPAKKRGQLLETGKGKERSLP